MGEVELCGCHGEPMAWAADRRYTAGGFWCCNVKKRQRMAAYYDANRERICGQRRDRYDRDWCHRIEKQLTDNARRRRQTIERRRQSGPLPE